MNTTDVADRLVITKLRRDPEGYWRARVSVNGTTLDVDRRFGSWQADVPTGKRGERRRAFVLPPVAARLQAKVRREERRT